MRPQWVVFVEVPVVVSVVISVATDQPIKVNQPPAEVQSVVFFNSQDEYGRWISMRVEVGSWVTLKATRCGPWSRDACTHGDELFVGAWKAQVLQFRWTFSMRRGK